MKFGTTGVSVVASLVVAITLVAGPAAGQMRAAPSKPKPPATTKRQRPRHVPAPKTTVSFMARAPQSQQDYFALGFMVHHLIGYMDKDINGARAMMQRTIVLMKRQKIGGEATKLANKIVPKLTGKGLDGMRASANLSLLAMEITKQAPSNKERCAAKGAELVQVMWKYLKKNELREAAMIWRKRQGKHMVATCHRVRTHASLLRFFDGFSQRYDKKDFKGAVAWGDEHFRLIRQAASALHRGR